MKTPLLAGVIGDPIGHSRSPRLHGYWLSVYNIYGYYVPLQITSENLMRNLDALQALGFKGVNVTLPHKSVVLSGAVSVSQNAARIGAANTLTFLEGGGYHADVTDDYGFIENLRQSHPDWNADAGPCVIYGAGGAARSVICALIDAGAREIRLTNRSRHRAEALREDFGECIEVVDWDCANDSLAGAGTIVNTTSLGMEGQPPLLVDFTAASPGAVVTDIVYTPLITPFLEDARRHGLFCVDGLGMLLHQAVPGFERWFGRRPEVTDDLRKVVLA